MPAPLLQQLFKVMQHPITSRQQLGRSGRRQPALPSSVAHQPIQFRQGCTDPEAQSGGQHWKPFLQV